MSYHIFKSRRLIVQFGPWQKVDREHSERLTGLSKRAIAKVTLTHGVLVILHYFLLN